MKRKPISPEHANYVKYVTIQNKVIVLKKDSNLDDFEYQVNVMSNSKFIMYACLSWLKIIF